MDIRWSALKHGVTEEGILHAVDFFLFRDDDIFDSDPAKVLVLGPDRAGNILEVIGTLDARGVLTVFHAMPARTAYLKLLEELLG